ncbi:MFS transporter [Rugosimonospora acidiphila]|uniref:MFS transporter n=1 Tax=Rugosimonospora acidiphila TaxID=556531 RepID=A0ABP9SN40_9ACTN
MGWAALSGTVPFYSLYALLFTHAGLTGTQISALFAIWSVVGVLAQVPAGVVADRYSRRGALVAGALLEAGGYGLWLGLPSFPGFAAGFALWGISVALISGTVEALLYDGLAGSGADGHFATVFGRVEAAGLLATIPGALAGGALLRIGGYPLVGWVSVACCLAVAALAYRLPEPPRGGATEPPCGGVTEPGCGGVTEPGCDADERSRRLPDAGEAPDHAGRGSYLAMLRTGLAEILTRAPLRAAVLLAAALGGVDAIDEYFPLMAAGWGVPAALVPVAVLGIPLAGAAGSAAGPVLAGAGRGAMAAVLVVAGLALGAAALVHRPVALAAVAVFYALYRLVLVLVDTRLQERIASGARATVTSVAGLGTDAASVGLFAAWAAGGLPVIAALVLAIGVALPRALRRSPVPAARVGATPR